MGFAEEFKQRNFSLYGSWLSPICILTCLALGIANLFHLSIIILFSVVCLVCSFFLLFIEIPLLLRICPTSDAFDKAVRFFSENWRHCALYGGMAAFQWIGFGIHRTTLAIPAVFLTLAWLCFLIAWLKKQPFQRSKITGGSGVAQMIV